MSSDANLHQSQRATVEDVIAQANAWYAHQVELLSKCHGSAWPDHQAWVCDYLKHQLRERLVALGWKARDEQH